MKVQEQKPWYQHPWLWIVLAPLITVVCVSMVTVTIAYRNADDVVIDNYYKQGRMINQSLEQDRRALDLNLKANLRFDRVTGEVFLQLPTRHELPKQLLLLVDHPFKASLDQQIILQEVAAGQYRGELEKNLAYSWYLSLMPELDKNKRKEAEWLLSGEIDFERGSDTVMKPRVVTSH